MNTQDVIGVQGHERAGAPDLGQAMGQDLGARELAARQHYVDLPRDNGREMQGGRPVNAANRPLDTQGLPYYYNHGPGIPAPYAAASAAKENLVLRSEIRQAASTEPGRGAVVRTDPITDGEVAYLKSMKDQAELAKFDDYVESFIDPRQPGNMKWLMEVYPDYVSRRLQQAHTDYEFALRNQMIDSWGINTFDDLHFKYMVDQGKVDGPRLQRPAPDLDASYTPGWLSPFNFQSKRKHQSDLRLPFASATFGKRPRNINDWTVDRQNRPLGQGNVENELARGMYSGDATRSTTGRVPDSANSLDVGANNP
jgi:hypothetical protein